MEDHQVWKFSQCFGERTPIGEVNDHDIISAVEFDKSGRFLATGDKGGRVVIFETEETKNGAHFESQAFSDYRFHYEFQSHEPEFDYLKSFEIDEKINRIRWCRPCNNSLFLLSTNDKTVKLWKVYEKEVKTVSQFNIARPDIVLMDVDEAATSLTPTLEFPKITLDGRVTSSRPRRVFAHAHAYHINSVAVNSDGETFISSDDLRINLWNLHRSDESYTIVDIKPDNMDDLIEVVTSAEFHPLHCNVFMYSSSRGTIRLGDMRARALCDSHSKSFEEPELQTQSRFSEITASISDIKFTADGRYIVSRDYLNLKIWDIHMESKPVQSISIHDLLKPKLEELYDNECIFDKFEVALSGDGNNIATGSYNNKLQIYDRYGKMNACIEASKMTNAPVGPLHPKVDNFMDFNRKIMHLSWHPKQPVVAVAGLNNLYIYTG